MTLEASIGGPLCPVPINTLSRLLRLGSVQQLIVQDSTPFGDGA